MDKLCKKILKYMNKAKPDPADKIYDWDEDLDVMAKTLNASKETIRAAINYLKENEYIHYCRSQHGDPFWFKLDYRGLTYKEQEARSRNEWLLDHLWLPLLVSFFSGIGFDSLIRSLIERLFP